MKVTFSRSAEADLESIGDFIARDNSKRAQSFVREIRARCAKLAAHPKSAPLVSGRETFGVRRLVHGDYLAFYRTDADAILVIRILHGAMDYDRLLFPGETTLPASDE